MYEKYHIVNSISDALEIINQKPSKCKIIAGGTDLMLEIERNQRPNIHELIDISRVAGLDEIAIDEKNQVHIGPMVTHNGCLRAEIIQKNVACLFQACSLIGSPQIRNRGTLAGNLITASPANDSISALLVLDAKVELTSISGKRFVDLNKFFTSLRRTVMSDNEILTDIFFTLPDEKTKTAFIKNALRNAQAISLVNVAVAFRLENGKIRQARVALGSVAPTVIRVAEVEEFLEGKEPSEDIFIEAGKLAAKNCAPISDIRSSDKYRKEMVAVHVKRALWQAFNSIISEFSPVTLWGKEKRANKPLSENSYNLSNIDPIKTTINGKGYQLSNAFHKNLMDLIRENALLTGTKEGCGEGECGACTVYMDGVSVLACLIPAPRAQNSVITTIEGIQNDSELHKMQQTFIDEGAVQCGYCTPGFVMSAVKLLEEKPKPTREEITVGISGNLCRCTGYYKIISAIEKASEM